jgi:hypothetical protein
VTCEPFNDENNHLLKLCKFYVPATKYRFIRLQTQKNLDYPYVVADFSFSARARRDANGQLLGLDSEDDGTAFLEDYFEKVDNNGRYGHDATDQSEAVDRQNR